MIENAVAGTGRVVVVGHRGAMGHAPENTVASFQRSVALGVGAHAFECDVRLTRDGEVVVLHDARVDRTTDGTGLVAELTLAQVKQLDAGSWFGPEFQGERIPTLDESLAFAGTAGVDIIIEIKGDPEPSPSLVDKTMGLVSEHGLLDRVAIISFYHPCLLWAREAQPEVATGLLFSAGLADPLTAARRYQADSLRPHHSRVTKALAEASHEAGLCLHCWTVHDPDRTAALIEMGVDSIGTDYPDRVRAVIAEAGRLPEG